MRPKATYNGWAKAVPKTKGDTILHSERRRERVALLLQVVITAAVIGWIPGNLAKLAIMLIIWAIGFGRISSREFMIFVGVNFLFSILDLSALRGGAFRFEHPDLIGLPVYEFFMWGFYTLNALRFVGRAPAKARFVPALVLALLFALPFATIAAPPILFWASLIGLVGSLAIFRKPVDFVYTAYLIAIGCVIEYVGVWTGQWIYPGAPPGGVALWFIPMWGGVGLFTGRLLAPLVYSQGPADAFSSEPGRSLSRE